MKLRDFIALVKGGPYIGPKGGMWADPQHTIPWRSDQEDTTSHLFHSAPAYAMTRIKREGLTPRKGAGLFQHGGYAEHSQGKVFLSNNLYAAKEWHSKVEDQLEHYHDDPKRHVAVMLRVKPRATHVDEVGDRDVSGSRYVRENVPASDIEFFHEGSKRWKPVKDFTQGSHGVPEDHYEAHASRDEAADAAEKKAKRDASAAKREAEKRASRERLAKYHEERAKREAAEAAVHFRDTDEGRAILARWKSASPEERSAKAKRILEAPRPIPNGPSMLSLGQRGEVWREALGVDEKGALKSEEQAHPKADDHPFAAREVSVYEAPSNSRQPPGAIMEPKAAEIVGAKPIGRVKIPASSGARRTRVEDLAGVPVATLDEKNVRSIERAHAEGVKLPPIKIEVHKNGRIQLLDGHHRLAEARASGRKEIDVDWTLSKSAPRPVPLRGLIALVKSAPPSTGGWVPIPGGHKGGWRRYRNGEWQYYYGPKPSGEHAEEGKRWKHATEFTEAEFAEGEFDHDATHWHTRAIEGVIRAWTAGGVDPHSKRPVKTQGSFDKLYQIEQPEVAGSPGFALLREMRTGKKMLMQHDRIVFVEHDPLRRKVVKKPEAPKWTPGEGVTKKPVTVSGVSGKRAPAFEGSRADKEKQPGLYAIENGVYPMMERTRVERDENDRVRKVKSEIIAVPDHGKQQLVQEFTPLITSLATSVQRAYGVKDVYERGERGGRATNLTKLELQRAGVEGLLAAIEDYDASIPFAQAAKVRVRDTIRLAAARERLGGVTLPEKHERNIARWLYARGKAARTLGVEDPSVEQTLPFFTLLKRHVHGRLGSGEASKPVPMNSYSLAAIAEGEAKPKRTGKTVSVESGTPEVVRDTRMHPGKRELAELYESYVRGQASSEDIFDLEDKAAFPAVSIGVGLDAQERVLVRRATQTVLNGFDDFRYTTEGRKKITYAADAGEMISLKLGLDGGDERTTAEIAREVPVYSIGAKGERKKLAERQAIAVVEEMIKRAMEQAQTKIKNDDAARLFAHAAEVITPPPAAVPGPTWHEIVAKRAEDVTKAQIGEYKDGERTRLRELAQRIRTRAESMPASPDRDQQMKLADDAEGAARRVDRMDEREIRMKIATRLAPETAEMRRLATQSVAVDLRSPGYEYGSAVTTLTDLATGRTRKVRIRTIKDLRDPEAKPVEEVHIKKSERAPRVTTGMLREALHYPRTMRLLTQPDHPVAAAPTYARRALELLTFGD